MSRASKTVRDALKHGQSDQFGAGEKYNFIRGNSGPPAQSPEVIELLGKIELLEYELSKMQDKQRSTQNNYDTVSRLLHEERLKVNHKEKMVINRNMELDNLLKVESNRVQAG